MYTALEDGKFQVTAAVSLLENSLLIKWDASTGQFQSVTRDAFEIAWRQKVDPVFGRLICWIMFSAGAEFLAKGLCLVRGVEEIRTEQEVPNYPKRTIREWVPAFRENWKVDGTMKVAHFGTLESLTREPSKKGLIAPLTHLCEKVGATTDQRELLFAAYDLLRKTIRNRDAHAYVPNVRDQHYSLVPELFSECFNLLISWLPDGSETLNTWKVEISAF